MSDLRQTLSDFWLILKNDRRIRFGAIGLTVVIVLVFFASGGKKRAEIVPVQQKGSSPVVRDNEVARDLVRAFSQRVDAVEESNRKLREDAARISRQLDEDNNKISGILEILTDKTESITRKLEELETNQQRAASAEPRSSTPAVEEENTVETWGGIGEEANVPLPPPVPTKPIKMKFIAPGDSVCVKLLTGVHAPVDGTPYPAVFKLTCPIEGPDGSSLDLGEARLIAAATGSEIDGRVVFRLTNLAIRQPDGRRTVVKVDGWVVGEDGIRGLEGKLIDKLGKTIAAVATTSYLAALGETNLDRTRNVQIEGEGVTISSSDLNFASASALNNAAEMLNKVLIKRYSELVPVVEVLSGREVAAVFSQPAEISLCEEECDSEALLASYSLD